MPENYIVLSNHATDYDMLFVAASFKRQMYFVGSEHIARFKRLYPFLKYAFEPIIRNKGASAAGAVLDIVRKTRKGANVCIFAEGVRTWDGTTSNILDSTAKLIKSSGCGLVTYKITGGYFASPMWAGASIRRGKVYGSPVNVFTAAQLNSMSLEEIYEIIKTDLYEDAYARQSQSPEKYCSKGLARGLEKLIYICPRCGKMDSFTSTSDKAVCGECGLEVGYNEYGMLSGTAFKTLKEFADWQKERLACDIEKGIAYTAKSARLSQLKGHKELPVTQGEAVINREFLLCGDKRFHIDDISDLAMCGNRKIVFTAKKEYYELVPQEGANALKFMQYYNSIQKVCK